MRDMDSIRGLLSNDDSIFSSIIDASKRYARTAIPLLLKASIPFALGAVVFFFGEVRGAADAHNDGYIAGCSVIAYQALCADAAQLHFLERQKDWATLLSAKSEAAEEMGVICHRILMLTGTGDDLSRSAARIATRYKCIAAAPIKEGKAVRQ